MRNSRLTDPLRRAAIPAPGRASYAVNELGDWMGIVALSVLVFDRTGSAMATAGLFIGTRFLPALLAPVLVARAEQPPPRFALPVIYCGEAAAFGALALLAGHDFSLGGGDRLATVDGALALTGRSLTRAVVAALLEPDGELRAGNAILNVAFTGGAAVGPALAGVVVAGFGVQTALLLDAVSFYAIAWILLTAGPLPRAEPEPGLASDRVRTGHRLHPGETDAAAPADRAGRRLRLLRRGDPDRGDLRQGDARRGRHRLRPAAGELGGRDGARQHRLRRRAAGRRCRSCSFFSTIAVGAGYLGIAAAPTLALACAAGAVGGAGNGVQWVSADQRRAGADRAGDAGAGDERAGVDRGSDAGRRLPARRPDRRAAPSPARPFSSPAVGVLSIVAIAVPLLGRNWPEHRENRVHRPR